MTCCFIGHNEIDENTLCHIREVSEKLILEKEVDTFYVGTFGAFEECVNEIMDSLLIKYPSVKCIKVLMEETEGEIYPEGIGKIPKRFKVSHRNRWMVLKSDILVAHITHAWGEPSKFVEFAKRWLLEIINV